MTGVDDAVLRTAAADITRRYRAFVSFADMHREATMFVLEHPKAVAEALEDEKRADQRVSRLVSRHLVKVARQEKAAVSGYDPDDECFYSRKTLAMLLPAVWDDQMLLHPPKAGGDAPMTSTKRDPATLGDWAVSVADARRAWRHADLSGPQRLALVYRFSDQHTVATIGRLLEVSEEDASGLVGSGLRVLVEFLGGEPGGCARGCECRDTTTEEQG